MSLRAVRGDHGFVTLSTRHQAFRDMQEGALALLAHRVFANRRPSPRRHAHNNDGRLGGMDVGDIADPRTRAGGTSA